MKIIPQRWRKSFFVILLPTLGPVKPSPITVAGTMGYSQDRSPRLVWQEWFVNHYSRAWRECDTWGMQITCCTPADGHTANSDKICLLLIICYSRIGFSPSFFKTFIFKILNKYKFSFQTSHITGRVPEEQMWNAERCSEMCKSLRHLQRNAVKKNDFRNIENKSFDLKGKCYTMQ